MRVAYFEKETRELVSLNYAEPRALAAGPAPGDALGYASYFAELLDEWAPADDPNETLFRLGTSVLDAMADGRRREPLARYFEYWLLRLQGVYPPHLVCHRCGERSPAAPRRRLAVADRRHSDVRDCADGPAGAAGTRLSPGALAFLHAVRRGPARAGATWRAGDVLRSSRRCTAC